MDNNLPRLSHVRMVSPPGVNGTETGVVLNVDVTSLIDWRATGGEMTRRRLR